MNEQPAGQVTTAERRASRERRRRMAKTIRDLVAERQQMLVYYWDLTEQAEPGESDGNSQGEILKQFCQLLVDYTALGHFEIYQRIVEGKERRRPVREIADAVYPAIAETTDALVDFNDKYDGNEAPENLAAFAADLSALGEALSVRIDLEDRLLDVLGQSLELS